MQTKLRKNLKAPFSQNERLFLYKKKKKSPRLGCIKLGGVKPLSFPLLKEK